MVNEIIQTFTIIALGTLTILAFKAYLGINRLYLVTKNELESVKNGRDYWKTSFINEQNGNAKLRETLNILKIEEARPKKLRARAPLGGLRATIKQIEKSLIRYIGNTKQNTLLIEEQEKLILETNKRQAEQDSKIEALEKRIDFLTERALIHEEEIADNFANKQEKPDEIKWIKRGSLTMCAKDFDKIQGGLYQLDQLMDLEDFCDVYIFTPEKVQIRKFDGEYIILKVVLSEVPPKNTRIFPLDFFKESN